MSDGLNGTVTLSRLGGRPVPTLMVWKGRVWRKVCGRSGKGGGWSGKVLRGRWTLSRCSRLFWTVQNSREWSGIKVGRVGTLRGLQWSFGGRSVVVNTVGGSRAWSGRRRPL